MGKIIVDDLTDSLKEEMRKQKNINLWKKIMPDFSILFSKTEIVDFVRRYEEQELTNNGKSKKKT